MTIENLSVVGGSYGVWDFGGSTNFVGTNLVASNQSLEGFRFELGTTVTSLTGITASGARGVTDSMWRARSAALRAGCSRTTPGRGSSCRTRERSRSSARRHLATPVTESTSRRPGVLATVGSTNLAAGLGNLIEDNGGDGIFASGNVVVAGNTVTNNLGSTGIEIDGGTATENVVFGNAEGISTATAMVRRVSPSIVSTITRESASMSTPATWYTATSTATKLASKATRSTTLVHSRARCRTTSSTPTNSTESS